LGDALDARVLELSLQVASRVGDSVKIRTSSLKFLRSQQRMSFCNLFVVFGVELPRSSRKFTISFRSRNVS